MKPEFIAPSSAVEKLVNQYIILRGVDEDIRFRDKFIPDGHIAIVFLLNVKQIFVYTDIKKTLPPYFLVIPKIMPLTIEVFFPADAIIIICKSSVLSSVFNIKFNLPLPDPDIEMDLFKGFPIIEKLRILDKTEDRIRYIEEYLLHNYPVANYKPDEIDRVYNSVMETYGNITVNEIIQSLQTNYRTFRRNFHRRVGISLKGLIRVVRVKYLWKLIMENKITDFQSIVVMGKFHDQSHLIKDFKKIVGETPKAFFSRNLDKVKVFSGLKD